MKLLAKVEDVMSSEWNSINSPTIAESQRLAFNTMQNRSELRETSLSSWRVTFLTQLRVKKNLRLSSMMPT